MKFLYPLLALVPIALLLDFLNVGHTWVFLASAVALVPLAGMLGEGTEDVAHYTGPRIGGLLNATLGNAAELIITIVAIREGLLDLVKASIAGSIIGNILLVMGASILIGGLKNGRQKFDAHIASVSATMMMLAVIALVIPALFSIGPHRVPSNRTEALSIGVAIVLLLLYALYILYTIFLHKPDTVREPAPPGVELGRARPLWVAIGVLVAATVGVVVMSEVLIGSVESVVESWGISELFLGVVLVPIIGNVAEHLVAVQVAYRNNMDLSFGIAIGSSLQIALFVAPVLVFVSLLLGHPMTLLFNEYELAGISAAIIIAIVISIDGESNWLEGAQLLAVYAIAGLGFFFLS